jgi:hypothetical protein
LSIPKTAVFVEWRDRANAALQRATFYVRKSIKPSVLNRSQQNEPLRAPLESTRTSKSNMEKYKKSNRTFLKKAVRFVRLTNSCGF